MTLCRGGLAEHVLSLSPATKGQWMSPEADMVLSWERHPTMEFVRVSLGVTADSWIGLGISPEGMMGSGARLNGSSTPAMVVSWASGGILGGPQGASSWAPHPPCRPHARRASGVSAHRNAPDRSPTPCFLRFRALFSPCASPPRVCATLGKFAQVCASLRVQLTPTRLLCWPVLFPSRRPLRPRWVHSRRRRAKARERPTPPRKRHDEQTGFYPILPHPTRSYLTLPHHTPPYPTLPHSTPPYPTLAHPSPL